MARPKKTELSQSLGTVKLGTKRGNPDFVSSSFYVPKQINLRFDRAILTLKAHGFEVDRSDILSLLMDRFASAVDDAETLGEDEAFHSTLAAAAERVQVLDDSAQVSAMVGQMKETVSALKQQAKEQTAEFEALKKEIASRSQEG